MNFVHLSILAGLAAASIPVMLHLLGRREPQLVDFPALRFVRQTQLEESTSWQLRHILLLMLRLLLIIVLVFALARPRVHSAMMGSVIGIGGLIVMACLASLIAAVARASHRPTFVWATILMVAIGLWLAVGGWIYSAWTTGPALPSADSNAPVAVAMIVDTSPSMAYQASNQSRLEAAKEMASWLLDRFPEDSHVGVLSGVPMNALSLNPRAADGQLSVIQQTSQQIQLLERIRTALDLVLADELERKEIYVLTDMNSAAWVATQTEVLELLRQNRDRVLVQIIDVGVERPVNWQLGDPQVDYPAVPEGGDVVVQVPIAQVVSEAAGGGSCTVELWQESIDPRLPVISDGKLQLPESKVVDRQVVELSEDGTARIEMHARNLREGTHHFTIRLDKNDPLPLDNARYCSVTARRQQPTVIVADDPEMQRVLQLIVAPNPTAASDEAAWITTLRFSQLPQAILTRYAVIVLYDVPVLATSVVDSLKEHVMGGGGLLLVPGPNLESVATALDPGGATEIGVSESAIDGLLPGIKPRLVVRPMTDRTAFWQPTAASHPVYQELQVPLDEIAWQLMPIFKSWTFDSLHSDAQPLAQLSNSQHPLMTAQNLGSGQIITLLTPIPDLERPGRQVWNEMWIAEQYWWAFGILSGSLRTLSGSDQSSITFNAGESIRLANESSKWPSRWDLYTPDAQRVSLEAVQGVLSIGPQSQSGNYHLRGNLGVPVTRGFSVNIPASSTNLQRVDQAQLDSALGEGCFRIARGQDEVSSSVGQARFGQELYPLLMLFVAGIFLAEQFMSNRFYKVSLKFGKAST
jgi:hypothetical protein